MDRRISYNWIKEHIKLKVSAEQFAAEFSLKSQTVDRVTEFGKGFSGVVTAKVTALTSHPNADKLKLATVAVGKMTLEVVCGAPNVAVGQIVALAPVGAKVQDAKNAGSQWAVKRATIRGVESNGMLCSQRELGLGDDHVGIMVLPSDVAVGKPLETALKLPDRLLDIEITSNRPDAMSVVGLAREAAAVFDAPVLTKAPRPNLSVARRLPLSIIVKEPKLCPRYQGVVMTGVTIKPSPLWLQLRLLSGGLRPINNVVDITNYILLEYGKPLHVFDYEKVAGAKIIVRLAKKGETLLALDGNTYKLSPDHLVIADNRQPIAVGGIMGGEASAATTATTTVIFESAVFDPVAIRKTSRSLNLHSDSSDLFEKGLRPESVPVSMLRAIELTQQLAGGPLRHPASLPKRGERSAASRVASAIVDVAVSRQQPTVVTFDPETIQRSLGVTIPIATVKKILSRLGFTVSGSTSLRVTVPWWREGDIGAGHDLIEEVARIYGYSSLPTRLPAGNLPGRATDPRLVWQDAIKDILVGAGFSEVYNYSLVSASLLKAAGGAGKDAIELANPLSEDLKYLRTSLLPQLLKNVADNLGNARTQRLFELSNTYRPRGSKELPEERPQLAGVVVDPAATFLLDAKGAVELMLKKIGITGYQASVGSAGSIWEHNAAITFTLKRKTIGVCGVVNPKLHNQFGIAKPVAAFIFDVTLLTGAASAVSVYQPIPEFPAIERDIALTVDQRVSWQQINDQVQGIDPLLVAVEYLSTFTDARLGAGKKSVAFRVVFRSTERTLKSEEADAVVTKIIKTLEAGLGAKLR